tara:strand:+ start:24482 stop:24925 length:444 start_codon:yes stop_codon:yes gene_type:complete
MKVLRFLKNNFSLIFKAYPLSFLILFLSCFQQERNCLDFQSGSFEFTSVSSEGDTLKTFFTRTKNIEIDYFENQIDSSSVNWVSECECILKKLNPSSPGQEKSIQMKILSTSVDEYLFEYSFVGDIENKRRGKAKKISNELLTKFDR